MTYWIGIIAAWLLLGFIGCIGCWLLKMKMTGVRYWCLLPLWGPFTLMGAYRTRKERQQKRREAEAAARKKAAAAARPKPPAAVPAAVPKPAPPPQSVKATPAPPPQKAEERQEAIARRMQAEGEEKGTVVFYVGANGTLFERALPAASKPVSVGLMAKVELFSAIPHLAPSRDRLYYECAITDEIGRAHV